MAQTFSTLRGLILGLALILGAAIASPAMAQSGFNPTQRAVNEDQLMKALKPDGTISGRVTIPNQSAGTLIQPEGKEWRDYRRETLPRIGAIAILGMLVVLCLFYAIRGKVRVAAGMSGKTIVRFNGFERFTHWLTASSFVILGLSGLNVTFGRSLLLPLLGHQTFTPFSAFLKFLHNYIGFAFMVGIVLMFVMWVRENIPNGTDVTWVKEGGGILSKDKHPAAGKFNGGQKILFWAVIVGGVLLSLSGLHLLFPNRVDGGVIEIQFQSEIHGIVAMLMIAMILAHIYIGTLGMEGAFDAMGTGSVDLNWAKEHHSLWVDEVQKGGHGLPAAAKVAPAE
ncbi:MAG: formate dehydrogenase subunit gamma [Proteobacteria bacterium]|nr:formate dehydrogenase subunit gamma [Pseudomonadota bacterium]